MSTTMRTIATWLLGVLAVVALTAAAVGVWARFTVADGDRFGDIASNVLDDPAVQAALADRVAAQVIAAVGVDETIETILEPLDRLSSLAPAIESAIQSVLSSRIATLLDSDRVQAIVGAAVERAHDVAMQLLRGDGLVDGVTIADGQVSLNLLPLIGLGIAQLQDLGLLTDLDVPDLSRGGDPATQIVELSAAIGRDLPADFGQFVVYESDRVDAASTSVQQAQRAVVIGIRAVWLLVALAVVLIAATLVVARHRWRTLLALSLGAAATMIVLRAVIHRIVDEAPSLATAPAGVATASIVLDSLTAGLLRIAAVLAAIAIAGVVISLLRRRWRRGDIELVVAVALGAVVVGLLGISIVSLVLGVVVAVASVPIGRSLVSSGAGPPGPDPGPSASSPATT